MHAWGTMLREMIRDDLVRQTGAGADAASLTLTTASLTGARWSTFAWWMSPEQPMQAVNVDRAFRRLVFAGVPGSVSDAR